MLVAILCSAFTGTVLGEDVTATWTASSGALGSGIGSGTITDSQSNSWSYTRTLISGSSYTGWSSNCIQLGKNGGVENLTLSTSEISGTIKSVSVECSSYQAKHNVSITVGGTTYLASTATASWTTVSASSGTGTSSGEIVISFTGGSRALYIKSITVVYDNSGSTSNPSLSVSPASIAFGEKAINSSNTETFNVTFANLTEDLSVSVGSGLTGVSVSPATISTTATSPQTITVTYAPSDEGSISGNITVSNTADNLSQTVAVTGSAYDPSNVDTYERYTGALVEGDYIIVANAEVAMKNVISSSRFTNETVTVSNDCITNPSENIIWHIAPDGDYYTMYNAAVGKYAAGTTNNNQGTLVDDVTDYARWDITYSYSNYSVVCYGRNSSSNKYLRRNGDYGWGTYANSTGNVPTFYKKVVANQVAQPTFSVAAGTYYETKNVELSCVTDGATIYYTTDGTTPSSSNGTEYTTAISVSTTTTIKAVAVKSGMADSDVATATYTIEQPYSTIPALFKAATSVEKDVRVTFDNWVVSGVSTNGQNIYVTDNSGNGFIIYFTSNQSNTFAAGKVLSGTAVACKLKLYNGAAELVNLDASDLTITTGGTVMTSNIAMADLSGVNTGALVSYNSLECSFTDSKYYLTDGTTTLQAYNTLYAFDEFEAGKSYNVTGVYVQYNDTKEIAPRSSDDIVEVVVTTPSITVDPATATPSASDVEGTLDITYKNLSISDMTDFDVQFYDSEGNELASESEPDWILVNIVEQDPNISDGYVVSYIMDENTGATRTAYFKVYAIEGEDVVYSNLVTVTQAAPVVDYATLPFNYDENANTANLVDGLSQNGLTGNYTNSPKIKFDDGGDYLVLKLNEAPGTITFDVKGNGSGSDAQSGTFDIMISSDGENYSTLATYSSFSSSKTTISLDNLNAGTRYIKWIYTTKSVGNVALGNINVIAGYAKTVTSNGWATWIAPRDVEVPTGVTAYMVENTTETSASLKELLTIPANEPVLLKNEGSYEFPVASEILDDVSGNLLSVSDGTIAAGKVAYVLAKNGDTACFKKWTGEAATLNGRVVMIVDEAAAPARGFFTLDDDDNTTTGIDNVNVNLNDNNVYDLQGRCVAQPAKGLYIVNGKKVIIK